LEVPNFACLCRSALFRFPALEAVILNKAMSLVVVVTAIPFRSGTVSFGAVAGHWPIILNLLAGSLLGAWLGAGWTTRLRSETLHKVIAAMLVAIAVVLVLGHQLTSSQALITGPAQLVAGVLRVSLSASWPHCLAWRAANC
jgi:uncharacterized protein